MKIVHLVLSEDFAGIEQHVDELLSHNTKIEPFLICNEYIYALHIILENITVFSIC